MCFRAFLEVLILNDLVEIQGFLKQLRREVLAAPGLHDKLATLVKWREYRVSASKFVLIASLFLCAGNALAQSAEKESAAVLELGGAGARSLTEGQSSFGPTVAVEVTPIENRLELEVGVTPLFRRHSTEWSIDLLFKKPWTISDRFEFMLGAGPEWIHTNAYGRKMNSVGAEVAPDFMFWSSKKHRFGWYLEPSYDYKFGPGHEHSLGISGGILIAIR